VRTLHQLGRAFIVFGYSLAAVGAITDLLTTLNQSGGDLNNVRYVLDIVSFPVSAISGLCAWWFLSALVVTDDRQITLIRRALLGLSIQALALSVVYLIVISAGVGLTWLTASLSLIGVGQVCASAGFLLIYFGYRDQPPSPDPDFPDDVVVEPELL
jgi:hypothetical protein